MTHTKFLRGLRKWFNYPSKKEAALITHGCLLLRSIAKKEAAEHWKKEYNRKKERDETCPRCRNKSIVDKISRVMGSGSVNGSFFLGTGSVYGRSEIDTKEVNHCNECGHQWIKYPISYKWEYDFIADWMNDLGKFSQGSDPVRYETVTLLKDIPAESIWEVSQSVARLLHYSTRENLSLSFLRTKFKSVYEIQDVKAKLIS